ncbi:MAG: hypothetical protein U0271_34670 [Polyangiaceae bacterium]
MSLRPRRRSTHVGALMGIVAIPLSCGLDLPEEPYSCAADGVCPDGYACKSEVCVREGSTPPASHAMRVSWINAAEMYWFESPRGGAALVVNDGFTPGARGLYELHVDADGSTTEPRVMLEFGEEFPTSSAVVAADADRYNIVTLRFPTVTEDNQVLEVWALPRDPAPSTTSVEPQLLYREEPPFFGGYEPAYIGAVEHGGALDLCFADPAAGGTLEFRRVTGLEEVDRSLSIPLPETVLPLSADCLLWRTDSGIWARAGLESPVLYFIADDSTTEAEVVAVDTIPGLPVYAFDERIVSLLVDDAEETAELGFYGLDGAEIARQNVGYSQVALEPHTGWSGSGKVLFAPTSSSPAFTELSILELSADGATPAATLSRTGTDALYSARAIELDGTTYVAWTAFHESLMDLWIATTPADP